MSNTIVGGNLIAAITGGAFLTIPLSRTVVGSSLLETSPSSILAAYIINTLDKMTWPIEKDNWPLFVSHMPDGDNVETDCGAVYDTQGVLAGRRMDGEVNPRQGIQIRIRSRLYEIGYAKIEDIALSLDGVANVSVVIDAGEYELQNVSRTSPIASLGLDGTKRRFLFTVNFLLTVRKLD